MGNKERKKKGRKNGQTRKMEIEGDKEGQNTERKRKRNKRQTNESGRIHKRSNSLTHSLTTRKTYLTNKTKAIT